MSGSAKLMTPGGGGVILQPASSVSSDVTVSVPSVNATLLTDSTGVLNIGSGQIYKDASGNVGIGTSSPTFAAGGGLQIKNGTFASCRVTYTGLTGVDVSQASDGKGYLWNRDNADVLFGTNNAERMRIDSSGNLLVGTSSGTGFCRMNLSTDSGTNKWDVGPRVALSSNFYILQNTANGVYIASGGNSWTSFSDERLKTDLVPITNAVEKVSQLRSVTGRYKIDPEGTSRSFLIAQDVLTAFPEAGEASDPERLGVQYTDVIPLLVAAIKELKAELDATKVKLTEVSGEVAALKGASV